MVSRLADSGCGSHCMVRAVAPTSTIGNSTPYWGLPLEHHRDQHLPSAPRSGLAPSTAAGSKRSSAEPSSCAIAGRIRANVRFRRIGGDSDWRRLPQLWAKRRSWCGQSWRNSRPCMPPLLEGPLRGPSWPTIMAIESGASGCSPAEPQKRNTSPEWPRWASATRRSRPPLASLRLGAWQVRSTLATAERIESRISDNDR